MNNNLLAQSANDGRLTNPLFKGTALDSLLKSSNAGEFFTVFIPRAVGLTLVAGVVIFFFVFLTGAIQWTVSGGDKGGVEAARSKLTNGIVGLVVLFSTFAIVKLIEAFFSGINILTIDIGPLVIQ